MNVAIFAMFLRHGLTVAAGVFGYKYGIEVEPQLIDAVVAAGTGIAAIGLSVLDKRKK
jgi:hypothetical protein